VVDRCDHRVLPLYHFPATDVLGAGNAASASAGCATSEVDSQAIEHRLSDRESRDGAAPRPVHAARRATSASPELPAGLRSIRSHLQRLLHCPVWRVQILIIPRITLLHNWSGLISPALSPIRSASPVNRFDLRLEKHLLTINIETGYSPCTAGASCLLDN
jgi:hypothetical protein